MDIELLNALGLDSKKDLKELLEDLENKQFEFFERLETVHDEARREELNDLLSRIDQQISQIKAQLKAMSSGIVIDTGTAESVSDREAKKKETDKKEAKKAAEEKKSQVTDRVQEIKKKEAERRKQADQSAAAAAQSTPQQGASGQQPASSQQSASGQQAASTKQSSANKQASANSSAQPAGNAQNGPKDLQQGLVLYSKKSFTGAFAIFKPLAEKGDASAQYMLGSMYHRGEGTPRDKERAEFWMEKAADAGDVSAQFDYAIMQLSDVNNQDLTIGMYYLGLAADQDHKDALLKYVELAQGMDDVIVLSHALTYCKKLIATSEDSFDTQKYTTIRNDLNTKYKAALRVQRINSRASATAIIGAVFSIISIIAIFLGTHQQYFIEETFLGNFPDWFKDFLFGGWMDITKNSGPMSAVLWVLLGWIFRTAGKNSGISAKARGFEKACVAFRYIATAGHVLISILAGTKLFGNFIPSAIAIAAFLLIGKFIGWILGKILRTR